MNWRPLIGTLVLPILQILLTELVQAVNRRVDRENGQGQDDN